MKIRKGFVSNSSSSSFIVDNNKGYITEDSTMSGFEHLSLRDFLESWLIDYIMFIYDYKIPEIVFDEEYVNSFMNGDGKRLAPKCVEDDVRKYVDISNTQYDKLEDKFKELNKIKQIIIDKIHHLLYPEFENVDLVYFSASDYNYIDEDEDTSCEEFWLDEVRSISGFKYIFEEH